MPLTADHITPLERTALREAIASPTHTLVRTSHGYIGSHRKGHADAPRFTRRLINRLDQDGLVHIDDPECPSEITLNAHGRQLAEQLRDTASAKAGAR